MHRNSLSGWDFMGHVSSSDKARRCIATHKLGGILYESMLAIQIKPRRCTTTYSLDEISYGCMSAVQIEPKRYTTHKLNGIS
jgi:hypothetical protein